MALIVQKYGETLIDRIERIHRMTETDAPAPVREANLFIVKLFAKG